MNAEPQTVQRVYLVLILFNTLAASFIWGINTLFLLDAGLNATAAFAANALFTAGTGLFKAPASVCRAPPGRGASPAPARPPHPLLAGLADARPLLGLGGHLGAARPWVHLLLRGDRGLARRRAQ